MFNSAHLLQDAAALLRPAARCLRECGGNAAVEFALISPLLFGFLIGTLVFGYALWIQNALNDSVAAAARCASDNPGTCGTSSQITAYAAGVSGANLSASNFTYTAPASGNCGYKVTGSYQINISIPLININNPTLTASACYPN